MFQNIWVYGDYMEGTNLQCRVNGCWETFTDIDIPKNEQATLQHYVDWATKHNQENHPELVSRN